MCARVRGDYGKFSLTSHECKQLERRNEALSYKLVVKLKPPPPVQFGQIMHTSAHYKRNKDLHTLLYDNGPLLSFAIAAACNCTTLRVQRHAATTPTSSDTNTHTHTQNNFDRKRKALRSSRVFGRKLEWCQNARDRHVGHDLRVNTVPHERPCCRCKICQLRAL